MAENKLTNIGESLVSAGYSLGRVSALEGISQELRQMSGAAFAREEDQHAKYLRALAIQYELKAKALRAEYEAKMIPEQEELFKQLERLGDSLESPAGLLARCAAWLAPETENTVGGKLAKEICDLLQELE